MDWDNLPPPYDRYAKWGELDEVLTFKGNIVMPWLDVETLTKSKDISRPCGESFSLVRVSGKSDRATQDVVHWMARYFAKEMLCCWGGFGHEYCKTDDFVAYLWTHSDCLFDGHEPCIGACYFQHYDDIKWTLAWVWFNPFFRRKGLLSGQWEDFRREFGQFTCQPPLSPAMQDFLSKEVASDGAMTD